MDCCQYPALPSEDFWVTSSLLSSLRRKGRQKRWQSRTRCRSGRSKARGFSLCTPESKSAWIFKKYLFYRLPDNAVPYDLGSEGTEPLRLLSFFLSRDWNDQAQRHLIRACSRRYFYCSFSCKTICSSSDYVWHLTVNSLGHKHLVCQSLGMFVWRPGLHLFLILPLQQLHPWWGLRLNSEAALDTGWALPS